jgi:2-oxoglutarate ferredoxin oxidoreductase subunit alpha
MISNLEPLSAKKYKRYAWAESGVSPRILPGQTHAVVYADSDEHTMEGHITESADVRKRMMDKRMKKIEGLRQEMSLPEAYPSGKADIVLIGWGSTYGAMTEAVDMMNSEGLNSQVFHFSDIFPYPAGKLFSKTVNDCRIFAVENNYTGQFADFLQGKTGISVHHRITKYDGRPFSPEEIVKQVKDRI